MAGRNRGGVTGMVASDRTGANMNDVTMMAHKWGMATSDIFAASKKMDLKLTDMVSICNDVEMTPNQLMAACSRMGVTVRDMIEMSQKEEMSLMAFMAKCNNIAKIPNSPMVKGPNSSMAKISNNTMMIRTGTATVTSDKAGTNSNSNETEKTSSKWNLFGNTKAKNLVTREDKKASDHRKKKGRSSELLAELRKIILDETTNLRHERPEFCEEIDRLQRNNDEGKELVGLVLNQLAKECFNVSKLQKTAEALDKTKTELQVTNYDLLCDNSDLLERIDWSRSIETRDEYERKMGNKRHEVKNAMQELRDSNQANLKELLELKAGKSSTSGGDGGDTFGMDTSTLQMDNGARFSEEEVRARIEEVEEEWRAKYDGLSKHHEYEKVKLQTQIQAQVQKEHDSQMNGLRFQHKQTVDNLRDDLEVIKSRQREKIAKVEQEYIDRIDNLNAEILHLREEAKKAERDHGYQLQQMENGHTAMVLQLNHDHSAELRRKQDSHKITTDTMKQEFNEELQQARDQLKAQEESWTQNQEDMQKRHKSEIRSLEKQHTEELSKRGAEALAQCKRLTDQMDEMERNLDAKLAEKIAALDAEKAQLKIWAVEKEASLQKEHADEKAQLRKDRDAYSAALLERDRARDKVDYLKDVEIKDRFQGLKEDVETLARSEWKPDPVKEKTLRLLTPTPKTLMRQVLQHSIWVVLHEHIFCSPFRVFGDEGEKYENDWVKDCGGKDPAFDNGAYTWPTPEVDTERWRFMTVKECRDFLRKPASPHDPRAKLKRSFADKRDAIRKTLSETLSEVIDVDNGHVQAIKDLAGKATNVWLEFSMQPYRILIVVQGAKVESIESRIIQARMSSFDLVLVPRLKSFGNSKGQDLKAEATIGNYDGEIVKIETMKPPSVMQRGNISLSRRPSTSR